MHTKGPWEVSATGRIFVVPKRNFLRVAEIETINRDWKECVANATIMAAAPELFESLTELLAILQTEYYLTTAETLVCQKAVEVVDKVKPPTEGSEHA